MEDRVSPIETLTVAAFMWLLPPCLPPATAAPVPPPKVVPDYDLSGEWLVHWGDTVNPFRMTLTPGGRYEASCADGAARWVGGWRMSKGRLYIEESAMRFDWDTGQYVVDEHVARFDLAFDRRKLTASSPTLTLRFTRVR